MEIFVIRNHGLVFGFLLKKKKMAREKFAFRLYMEAV